MTPLSPETAARLAKSVYDIRTQPIDKLLMDGTLDDGMNILTPESAGKFSGASGAGFIKQLSRFGYVAEGANTRKGELFVVTRGTNTLFDGITDGNVGYQKGPSGHVVHAGFNETWKSFRDEMMTCLRRRNPAAIHCVGHSLGGALAFLNADHLSNIGAGKVYLYTFGSPRVGFRGFSESLTRRLGPDSIFRVSHTADPVTMVPLFPFFHAPITGTRYEIANGGGVFRASAHKMEESYIDGVGHMSWSAVGGLYAQARAQEVQSEEEMLNAIEKFAGPVMYSVKFYREIMRGIRWVMKKAGLAGLVTTQLALSCGFTAMDQIAEILAQGSRLSEKMGNYVNALVRAIMRFIGKAADTAINVTAAFLRWVLGLLLQAIVSLAQLALRT